VSSDIKKKLEEEIQVLEKELREELPRALKTAAALGDLSENADYQAARERQDFVRVRLGQLKQRLADLSMINFDKIPRDRISLGSKVVLLDVDKNDFLTNTHSISQHVIKLHEAKIALPPVCLHSALMDAVQRFVNSSTPSL